MSGEMIGVIGILGLFVLLAIRLYIGMAMMVVGFVGTCFIIGWDPAMSNLGLIPMDETKVYSMSVIPLFILMGQFALCLGHQYGYLQDRLQMDGPSAGRSCHGHGPGLRLFFGGQRFIASHRSDHGHGGDTGDAEI